MNTGRILRIVAAVAILISGIVHLDLYFNVGYRFASPDVNFGRSLLLNGFGAGIIAVALVARREWFVRAIGIGYAVSTIGVFWYTHAGNTFLGFSHGGPAFDPSPQAQLTVIMGIITILTLAATFVPALDTADGPMDLRVVGAAGAIAAIALIGLTIKWQPEDTETVDTATPTSQSGTETTVAGTETTVAGTATTVAGATTVPGETTTTVAGGAAPAAGGDAVEIKDFAFAAKDVSVAKGTTVTWTNDDTAKHSVVSSDTSFVSDDLAQGATYQYTFDTDGTFSYICGIHPYMTGTITVTG